MHCPRCGARNEPGDRYCSACGAGLRGGAEEAGRPRSVRERAVELVGTTRKARLISAVTALAIVVAIAAFIALDSDEGIPRDAYTVEADRICLNSKRGIVAARVVFARQAGQIDPGAFARTLVPVVGKWRAQLRELAVPPDRLEEARRLEAALLDAEVRIAKLARVADRGEKDAIVASAKRADEASTGVEEAVSDLGLSECADATIGFTPERS